MKALLIGLLFSASLAHAETVTLAPDDCGYTVQCINIGNDAALDVDLYSPYLAIQAALYIEGVQYLGLNTIQTGYANAPFQAADGSTVYLTAHFSTTRVCIKSGRGQTCKNRYNLLGGSLTR